MYLEIRIHFNEDAVNKKNKPCYIIRDHRPVNEEEAKMNPKAKVE